MEKNYFAAKTNEVLHTMKNSPSGPWTSIHLPQEADNTDINRINNLDVRPTQSNTKAHTTNNNSHNRGKDHSSDDLHDHQRHLNLLPSLSKFEVLVECLEDLLPVSALTPSIQVFGDR